MKPPSPPLPLSTPPPSPPPLPRIPHFNPTSIPSLSATSFTSSIITTAYYCCCSHSCRPLLRQPTLTSASLSAPSIPLPFPIPDPTSLPLHVFYWLLCSIPWGWCLGDVVFGWRVRGAWRVVCGVRCVVRSTNAASSQLKRPLQPSSSTPIV